MKTNEIIKELLETNNLSQDKLAKILKVSQKAISNWVNGLDVPKASSMLLIYEHFGITPNELLGIDEPTDFELKNKKTNNIESSYLFKYEHNNTKLIHKES